MYLFEIYYLTSKLYLLDSDMRLWPNYIYLRLPSSLKTSLISETFHQFVSSLVSSFTFASLFRILAGIVGVGRGSQNPTIFTYFY